MQHVEVSCAVRRIYKSLGFKGLTLLLPSPLPLPLLLRCLNENQIIKKKSKNFKKQIKRRPRVFTNKQKCCQHFVLHPCCQPQFSFTIFYLNFKNGDKFC